MIVKTITKRDNVEKYVNLIKIEFAEFIEFDLFIFFTIKFDATNSIDLSIDEQRNLAILRKDYKKRMCQNDGSGTIKKKKGTFPET
jgi:hypothetical protein